MKTVVAFETMKKILPDIVEIFNDESIQEFKKAAAKKQNNTGELLSIIIPMFTGTHRDALLRIVSAVTGKDVETIEEQDFKDTVSEMGDSFVGDMLTFFILCVRMVARA